MSKYNERTENGNTQYWDRARQLVFDSPLDGTEQVTVYAAQAIRLPDGTCIEKSTKTLSGMLNDNDLEIPIIDPADFSQTAETITAGELWRILASVYVYLDGLDGA